jgi:hypothetical protein
VTSSSLRLALLGLFTTVVAAGCVGSVRVSGTVRFRAPTATVTSTRPPPPVRPVVVARPPAPSPTAFWVEGHYKLEGGSWVWEEGHWDQTHGDRVWVPPVAEDRGDTVVYHPGYWAPPTHTPPPVYRTRTTVRVIAGAGGTTTVRPESGGSTTVVSGSGGTTAGRGGTTVVAGSGGTTTVGGRGGTTVVSGGGTTGGSAGSTATPSRPGMGTPVVDSRTPARPGTASETVVIDGGGATPARPGTESETVVIDGGGATGTRPGTASETVVLDPDNVAGGGTTGAGGASAGVEVDRVPIRPGGAGTATTGMPFLRCQVGPITRIPFRGILRITGRGFAGPGVTGVPLVRIGSEVAPLVRPARSDTLDVRILGTSGPVTVTVGGETARCGEVEVLGG